MNKKTLTAGELLLRLQTMIDAGTLAPNAVVSLQVEGFSAHFDALLTFVIEDTPKVAGKARGLILLAQERTR